jgi:hypothetical protein
MENFSQFLEHLPLLLNQASFLIILICIVAGLALTYAGLKVYWIGVFLAGMPIGMLLGGGVAAAVGWGEIGIVGGALAGGTATGLISISLTRLAVFLVGVLAGALLAILLGAREPMVVIAVALVCGLLANALHDWAIILSTAITGSVMLVFATLNLMAMARYGRPAVLPGDYVSYLFHLGERAYHSGSFHGIARSAVSDVLVFLFFFTTGVVVQLNWQRILKKTTPARPGRPEAASSFRKEKNSPSSATACCWQVAVFDGKGQLVTHLLPEGCVLMGRDASADIVLDDEMISRRHLQATVTEKNDLVLQDLGTGNGTWKFGKQAIKEDRPNDKDWYQLGRLQLVFSKGQ